MRGALPVWLALLVSPLACATLGGDATSVDADRAQIKAEARAVTQGAGYTVQELQLPSGTLVHEYVSAAGKVFAVSWSGRGAPNLQTLLGSYFPQYTAAAATSFHNHHHLFVRQQDLVVQSNRRPRAFSGRAYVPSLLPADFSVDSIQ